MPPFSISIPSPTIKPSCPNPRDLYAYNYFNRGRFTPIIRQTSVVLSRGQVDRWGCRNTANNRMELLHPAIWHDHDIGFVKWLHPAMWHVALESWQWIHQVAAPCNVIRGSGMTWHWIRPNVRHIGILHGFHFNTSPQLTCHSVPVCEILSKSDRRRQKKITSCRFSRWRISAILDCRDPIMGFEKPS